ncbi:MAG: TIGR02757 family protein [Desulfatiglandaceae bacterium]
MESALTLKLKDREESLGPKLDGLYSKYNDKTYITFDPIKYVYRFENPSERELVGLIASSLAFGRVTQIFKAVDRLLGIVGGEPLQYILTLDDEPDAKLLDFKYRFVTGSDLYRFFQVIKGIFRQHGSLGGFVRQYYQEGHYLDLLARLISLFDDVHYLVPCSLKGSPCKRLCMYFRWMVRNDNIDLGLWDFINPRELVIPLDTHIFQVAGDLGFTSRRTPSLSAALEVTDALRGYSRNDPVKYDWALSHIGIIANNFPEALPSKE